MSVATSVNNYEYLDILDRAWDVAAMSRRSGGVLCDIGSASFWYAAALQAFFRPDRLLGVEIEGHRLFRDGRSRIDHAAGYVKNLPNGEYIIADYARYAAPADVITAWFPFLTPAAILAWRLPLSLLAPEKLLAQVKRNLNSGGAFVMVNHGRREAILAEAVCVSAGLALLTTWAGRALLSEHRARTPILSVWQHA